MSQAHSPFKFLDSYQKSDADVFFGREKETQDLYDALSGVKHLMVYGPSGSGKTSLVECGLRNQFSDADWYAITIRKGADINVSVFAGINNALIKKIETDLVTKMPVDPQIEFGQAIEQLIAERYQPVYLLFDQFEELLISGDAEEKKKFFTQLNKLVRNKVPCRILLIMREEFIGHLSEFEPLFPCIFQHRFRVEKMRKKNVEEVIYHILEAPKYQTFFNVVDSHKLAESILSKLPDKRKEIELAHVQVFLGELWDRANAVKKDNQLPVLGDELINDDDNLEAILESFLKKQMTELEGSFGKRVPLELLAGMISERFTKLQVSEVEIITDLEHKKVVCKKPITELLNELEQHRILRTIKVGDETQYEISHDVLALVVGQNLTEEMKMREKAGDIYKSYQERPRLFNQDDIDYLRPFKQSLPFPPDLQARINESVTSIKKKRDEELAKTRKQLRTVFSILIIALLGFFTAGYFGYKAYIAKNEAKKETRKSQSLTLATLASEQLDKNPTLAIRIAELALQNSPTHPPTLLLQRIVSKIFYESLDSKKLFYANNLEHEGVVYSAVFSPDGKKIVTASFDKTAKIWAAESGKEILTLKGHKHYLLCAVFSPDGKKIVTASSDTTAKMWDAESGKEIHTLKGHKGLVYIAVFSPNGKKIVTASTDKTAKIWDVESGKEIHTLKGHEKALFSAVFSSDGKKIVTASEDKTAKIWDTESGKEIHMLKGHENAVNCAVFSPDGKMIVTSSRDKTTMIWDAESGKEILSLIGHVGPVYSAVFSPDGKKIVTASKDKTAKLWDVESGKEIHTFKGHDDAVTSVVFSFDGKMIVTASRDKTAKIWDAESGKEIHILKGHEEAVTSVIFSPDGKKIVTASNDKTAKIWVVESRKEKHTLKGHDDFVFCAVFSPDGKKIVTASRDSTANIWDAESEKKIHTFKGHEDAVTSVVFSPDGKKVLTASRDTSAKIWDAESGKEVNTLEGHKNAVTSAVFSADGKKIVTASSDKTAKIWDTESGKVIHTLKGHKAIVNSAVFSPDGEKIVTASSDKTAKIWDAESGLEIHTLSGHQSTVYSAVFSPDGKGIVTASGDGTAKIWDAESGKKIYTLKGHEFAVYSAVFSPDGKKIVTASFGKEAKIWDTESGKEIYTLKGHEGLVYCAVFSPDGKKIVTASSDSTAKMWEAESGKEIQTFKGHEDAVYSAVFSLDGKKIVTASRDKIAKIWLTSEGIKDWLSGQKNIYRLFDEDLKSLGIDFIDLDKKVNHMQYPHSVTGTR